MRLLVFGVTFNLSSVDTAPQILTLDDADTLLRGHVGLLCGPAISRPGMPFSTLAATVALRFNAPNSQGYLQTGQEVIKLGTKADELRSAIRDTIAKTTPFTNIKRVAQRSMVRCSLGFARLVVRSGAPKGVGQSAFGHDGNGGRSFPSSFAPENDAGI